MVAVTAHALKRETDAEKSAGRDGVICKPFEVTALGDALAYLLTDVAKALNVPDLVMRTANRTRPLPFEVGHSALHGGTGLV